MIAVESPPTERLILSAYVTPKPVPRNLERFTPRAHALVPLVALLGVGCATVGPHPDDAGDVCAAQRAELRGAQDYYTQAVIKGVAIGGLVGGVAGALIGGSGKSAAIGAAAGAAAGGIGGYYMAKQQAAADAASLSDAVLKDVVAENQEIDRATAAFARLRECRFAAARQVKDDFAAKRIAYADAVSRLDAMKRQFDADLVIAENVGAEMADRAKEFQYASDELVNNDPEAKAYVEAEKQTQLTKPQAAQKTTPPTKPRATQKAARASAPAPASKAVAVAKATETNQVKQKAFSDDVAVARTQAQSAFTLEGQVGLVTPACGNCGEV
jgi:hypothetical protein